MKLTDVDRCAQLYTQRKNFILQMPGTMTADIAFPEDALYPTDFIVAGTIIADRLERKAAQYREWVADLQRGKL